MRRRSHALVPSTTAARCRGSSLKIRAADASYSESNVSMQSTAEAGRSSPAPPMSNTLDGDKISSGGLGNPRGLLVRDLPLSTINVFNSSFFNEFICWNHVDVGYDLYAFINSHVNVRK